MGKKFINKVWNASRFALMQIGDNKIKITENIEKLKDLTGADKKIIKQLKETNKEITKCLEDYQFGNAAHLIYDSFGMIFAINILNLLKNKMIKKQKKFLLMSC